jgi:hypothetical protein
MTYWQLGIRNGSMCNESDVFERAVANPETIQNGVMGSLGGLVTSASVELSKFLDFVGVLRPGVPQMSGCVLRNFKSERFAAELFRTLDVVEKMVDERGFEPPASSLRTRKNLR